MKYEEYPVIRFFNQINSEKKAIDLIWKYKTSQKPYKCPRCCSKKYYQHIQRPEIRECNKCGFQHRLRVKTIFENSKLPMLTWVRAIYLMMMGKRGISALELKRQLSLGSYKTAFYMLHRIRKALLNRDKQYQLEGIVELDGASFGKRATSNQEKVLIGVESKVWLSEKGKTLPKAGFAKVFFGKENRVNIKQFLNKNIKPRSELHTDAARVYYSDAIKDFVVKPVATYNEDRVIDIWLPWVHRFISNAKSWILGTHHGVKSKYLKLYLAEYTYRFNRRHDVKKYFSRALYSCLLPDIEPINAEIKLAA